MKFSISKEDFLSNLNIASGFAGRENLLPILATVMIEVSDTGHGSITCTDMEAGIVTAFNAPVTTPGRGCLSAARLRDYVGGLEPADINLSVNGSGRLNLTAGKNKATFPVIDANGYPDLPKAAEAVVTIGREVLVTALQRCLISTERAEGMVGVHRAALHIEPKDNTLTIRGSDDHTLSICTLSCVSVKTEALDIHRDSAGKALRFLRGSDEDSVKISFDTNHVFFSCGASTVIIRRMMAISHPGYLERIPKEILSSVTVNGKALDRAIRSARSVADQTSSAIDFDVQDSELTVRSGGSGGEVANVVPCACEDTKPFLLRANYSYVCEFLGLADGDVVIRHKSDTVNEFNLAGDSTYRHFIAGMHRG